MIFGLLLPTEKWSRSPSESDANNGSTSVFPMGMMAATRSAPFSGASGSARVGATAHPWFATSPMQIPRIARKGGKCETECMRSCGINDNAELSRAKNSAQGERVFFYHPGDGETEPLCLHWK